MSYFSRLLNMANRGVRSAIAYVCNAVNYDGSTTWLSREADITGLIDGDKILISVWFKLGSDSGVRQIWRNTGGYCSFQVTDDDFLQLIVYNEAGPSIVLNILSSTTHTVDGLWHHALFAADLSTAGRRYVYVDDVDVTSVGTFTEGGTMHFATGDWGIGAQPGGTQKITADLAEVFITNEWLDISDAGNRAKFSSSGKPVSLGPTGSAVTGTQPLVYLKNAAATWQDNAGSGGNFTANGTFTNSSTTPCD